MKKIKFRPISLDEKRCLPPVACEALGLRANPRANEATLLEMRDVFDWEELRASGLWVDAEQKRDQGRRPNSQYHGWGQVGKKAMGERLDESDKTQWGWCEPVLIPYFNEAGELVKLRPHKGGATGDTAAGSARGYVPRDYRTAADRVEKFFTVIICEGEYKAAIIWLLWAHEVFVGTSGYTGKATPSLQKKLIPIGSFIITTEILPEALARELSPRNRMIYDSKNFLYYYRLTPEGRMLFGGRAAFFPETDQTVRQSAGILRRGMIDVYPQLSDAKIDYVWGGTLDFAFDIMPHAGQIDGMYYALGYAGHGVAMEIGR